MNRSIAIDHLLENLEESNSKVIYIYFDYKSQLHQTPREIAGQLLRQLVSSEAKIPPTIEELYDDCIKADRKPVFRQGVCQKRGKTVKASGDATKKPQTLVELIQWFAQTFQVFAIFDAFDECGEQWQTDMLKLLSDLQASGFSLLQSTRLERCKDATVGTENQQDQDAFTRLTPPTLYTCLITSLISLRLIGSNLV